ncbi:ComEC/Rec2 family competence protein [Paenibacillus rhizophilus]|uniref:ComEC family competence protein n=1 Tax=Paenibacillus rhizophilus TaxID=1850366 RepID=A0A3N9P8D2_9BACL|nr:ComEC/Rec2 family competence protein [Paenibacillus rhizophilus]RQW11720.1 ComEC family competence protein [Paenibacillus rhizophilus]
MRRRPQLYVVICWVAGNAAASMLPAGRLFMAWAGVSLLLAAAIISGRWSRKQLIMLWMTVALGGLYWEWNDHRNASILPEALGMSSVQMEELAVYAEGTIVSTVERDGDRVDFTVKLDGIRSSGVQDGSLSDSGEEKSAPPLSPDGTSGLVEEGAKPAHGEKIAVQLKLQAEQEIAVAASWRRGDRVAMEGTLSSPSGARNFGGFDYRGYLRNRHIHWLLKISGTGQIDVSPPGSWSFRTVLRWNDEIRAQLGAELESLFRKKDAGYLKGLIIGMQDELDPETYREFSRLGLTHILAISGMHVAVYAGFLLFVLSRLRFTRETTLTVTLLLVPAYVILSGAGPSVVRAGMMSMIALYAARMGVLKDGMHILAASALLMLVWEPYFLLNVSFQLSFLVTAGLMVYVPLATPLVTFLPRRLGSAVAVTLVAQLVSFPLTIYYFNQFALLSFAANLALVPFITFAVLPAGTAALLLGKIWPSCAKALAHAVEMMNDATFNAVEWTGRYAGITIWRSPSLLWIALYYALLYVLLRVIKHYAEMRNAPLYAEDETRPLEGLHPHSKTRHYGTAHPGSVQPPRTTIRWRLTAVALTMSFALLLYTGYRPEKLSAEGSVRFLDVGQGDSILVTTPEGAHILVDGGGTVSYGSKEEWRIRRSPYEVGAKTLVPLLKKRGIHRLDAVILTHADQDHAGGLQAVLEEIPVSALLFNGTLAEREEYIKLMKTAVERGVKLYGVHRGMTLSPDDSTKLSFMWPEPLNPGEKEIPVLEEQNLASVVFRLDMSGRSFLFTGDIDTESEGRMITAIRASGDTASPVDVLKAAHHGSKSSNGAAWLEYWKPSAAVVSAGVNNLYGHPSKETLERFRDAGIVAYRTDRQGEIQMRVYHGDIEVRHMLEAGGGKSPAP